MTEEKIRQQKIIVIPKRPKLRLRETMMYLSRVLNTMLEMEYLKSVLAICMMMAHYFLMSFSWRVVCSEVKVLR